MTKKQKKVLIRICVSALLFIVAFLLPVNEIVKVTFYLSAYLIIGYDVLIKAIRNIARGEVFDENFLMALATVVAIIIKEYPEAVAVMLFYQVGELFQGIAVGKSRKSIAELMDIRPDSATVLRDGVESNVSPEDVGVGEIIIIRPGEKVPLDGVIVGGTTTVNTAALTGESLPRDLGKSDNVVSGSINIGALIKVKTTGSYSESTVSKILALVENSSAKKAKTENFITRFARVYTPSVVVCAVLLAIVPPFILNDSFYTWINRALIFLVVSCPCALVISVPLSFFGGIGGASKKGILIKGSNYLEALAKIKTVVFDKTGTLTYGNFEVTAIHPVDMPEDELLDIVAMAESYSNHPIAESIIRAHLGHIDKNRIEEISELPGLGIKAVIDGKSVLAGSGKLMDSEKVSWEECDKHSGTIVHIAVDNIYVGHIVISDKIKEQAKDTIYGLKKSEIRTVMLTGDIKSVGEKVGDELKIDEVYTELMPNNKVEIVERLINEKNNNFTVAFAGDGVNDAPVLARADVGIAMGAMGSDAAIEAADIVLMDDNPLNVVKAIRISRKTMRIVKENIVFALLVKAVVLVLGAVGIANMWFAVFADVGVMILAILNAVRALKSN